MTLRRVFLAPERIAGGTAALTPEAAHYLRDVLRLAPGTEVELFDGAGAAYPAVVEDGFESLRLGARRDARPPLALWLLVALAKGEKMDLVVQKATELGATRITPFAAERSVVKLDADRGAGRAERWRRIAAEAARQCGRADVPAIAEPAPLPRALGELPAGFARFVFHPGGEPLLSLPAPASTVNEPAPEPGRPRLTALPGVAAVIGPEGGLSPEEVQACEAAGARRVSLGPRILRAETAALVATALLQARFGDLS